MGQKIPLWAKAPLVIFFNFFYLAIIVLLTTHLTKVLHTKRMLLKFVVFELIAQLDLVGIPQIFTLKN